MIFDAAYTFASDNGVTLLWENPNPSSDFSSGQVLSLDLTPYKFFYILIKTSTVNDKHETAVVVNNPTIRTQYIRINTDTASCYRPVSLSDTSIGFGLAEIDPYESGAMINTSSSMVIPVCIYGLK